MRAIATRDAPPPSTANDLHIAAGALLTKLDSIESLLRDLLENAEQEPDFDVTYVVGGQPGAAGVVPISLPNTLRHVEITVSAALSTTGYVIAVFAGNVALPDAQNRHALNATVGQQSSICCTNGGTATARDYLDGSGLLTVYFSGSASVAFANVRIRALDRLQPRRERT